jgi:hypothetical protein
VKIPFMGLYSVQGKLTSTAGDIRRVELNVSTRELPSGEDEAVIKTVLVSTDIPDGDYILEYHCFGFHHDKVRVKFGRLVAQ